MKPLSATPVTASGRYAVFHGGRPCGEERWRIETGARGSVAMGEQRLVAPHPYPSVSEYRVTLNDAMRVTGLEVRWTVGSRRVHAVHESSGRVWRVRIESEGQVREQHGDYPEGCEVEFGTPLFTTFILARRDFQLGGEHEFPALRIGPPWMAVSPERMLLRCVERAVRATPWGERPAKRYITSLPPRPEEEGYSFWADEEGLVLETWDGLDDSRPWMRLTELTRGG